MFLTPLLLLLLFVCFSVLCCCYFFQTGDRSKVVVLSIISIILWPLAAGVWWSVLDVILPYLAI